MTQVIDILRQARQHVWEVGLAHSTFCASISGDQQQAAVCIIGAINWAATRNPRCLNNTVAREAWQAVKDQLTIESEGVSSSQLGSNASLLAWNDEKDADGNYVRTAEDVIALFDRTVERLVGSSS